MSNMFYDDAQFLLFLALLRFFVQYDHTVTATVIAYRLPTKINVRHKIVFLYYLSIKLNVGR